MNTAVNWPTGVGGKGSDGVTGQVKQTPGAHRIRRADLRTAEQDHLRIGAELGWQVRAGVARNRSPPRPTPPPSRCRPIFAYRSPTRPGTTSYPMSSFTWLLLYEDPQDKNQARDDGRVHEVGAH